MIGLRQRLAFVLLENAIARCHQRQVNASVESLKSNKREMDFTEGKIVSALEKLAGRFNARVAKGSFERWKTQTVMFDKLKLRLLRGLLHVEDRLCERRKGENDLEAYSHEVELMILSVLREVGCRIANMCVNLVFVNKTEKMACHYDNGFKMEVDLSNRSMLEECIKARRPVLTGEPTKHVSWNTQID